MFYYKTMRILFFSFLTTFSYCLGNIQSPSINLSMGKSFSCDMDLIASKCVELRCGESLRGNGLIQSPSINIFAKKIEFTGTIKCDGTCNIFAQEPFDETIFKKEGTGNFVIKVEPNLKIFQEMMFPNESKILQEINSAFSDSFNKNNDQKAIALINAIENHDFEFAKKLLLDENINVKFKTADGTTSISAIQKVLRNFKIVGSIVVVLSTLCGIGIGMKAGEALHLLIFRGDFNRVTDLYKDKVQIYEAKDENVNKKLYKFRLYSSIIHALLISGFTARYFYKGYKQAQEILLLIKKNLKNKNSNKACKEQ